MEEMPKDPMMLLSWVNLKLRDFYPNLDEMCRAMDIEREAIEKPLTEAGFEYNEAQNKFW